LWQNLCKTLCSSSSNLIASEIQARQRWAQRQNLCKTLCAVTSYVIASKTQERQRWEPWQHSYQPPCPQRSELIVIKMQLRQMRTLGQDCCKPVYILVTPSVIENILYSDATAVKIKCGDAAQSRHFLELLQAVQQPFSFAAHLVIQEVPA
jgi:hypothetical protein